MFLCKVNRKLLSSLVCLGAMFPSIALTQTDSPEMSLSSRLPTSWEFSPPNTGQPDNREGGATRGPLDNNIKCLPTDQNVTALVPKSGKGYTAQAYPTFFWYLPANSGEKLQFILKNQQGNEIYATEYSLLNNKLSPKIMSLTLPANSGIDPLEIGQEYHWELVLICNRSNDSDFIRVQAEIQRIAPEYLTVSEIQTTTLADRVHIYADARLWYETLETMVKLRRSQPNDNQLLEAWTRLLNSVGLKNLNNVN